MLSHQIIAMSNVVTTSDIMYTSPPPPPSSVVVPLRTFGPIMRQNPGQWQYETGKSQVHSFYSSSSSWYFFSLLICCVIRSFNAILKSANTPYQWNTHPLYCQVSISTKCSIILSLVLYSTLLFNISSAFQGLESVRISKHSPVFRLPSSSTHLYIEGQCSGNLLALSSVTEFSVHSQKKHLLPGLRRDCDIIIGICWTAIYFLTEEIIFPLLWPVPSCAHLCRHPWP